ISIEPWAVRPILAARTPCTGTLVLGRRVHDPGLFFHLQLWLVGWAVCRSEVQGGILRPFSGPVAKGALAGERPRHHRRACPLTGDRGTRPQLSALGQRRAQGDPGGGAEEPRGLDWPAAAMAFGLHVPGRPPAPVIRSARNRMPRRAGALG